MTKQDAKKRIEELTDLINYHAKKYYDEDTSEISDYEYDALSNELKALEKQYPEFAIQDSRIKKIGGTVKKGFTEVTHEVPLQSLQDVFSFDEIIEFDEKIR